MNQFYGKRKEIKKKEEKKYKEVNERNVRNGSAVESGGLSSQEENTLPSICAHLHMNWQFSHGVKFHFLQFDEAIVVLLNKFNRKYSYKMMFKDIKGVNTYNIRTINNLQCKLSIQVHKVHVVIEYSIFAHMMGLHFAIFRKPEIQFSIRKSSYFVSDLAHFRFRYFSIKFWGSNWVKVQFPERRKKNNTRENRENCKTFPSAKPAKFSHFWPKALYSINAI